MEKTVTIVGSGLIGSSWATLFSRGGYNVHMYDSDETRLDNSILSVKKNLESLGEYGLLNDQNVEDILKRVSCYSSLEIALRGAFYVQEKCSRSS